MSVLLLYYIIFYQTSETIKENGWIEADVGPNGLKTKSEKEHMETRICAREDNVMHLYLSARPVEWT